MIRPRGRLQFLHGSQHPEPHGSAIQIPGLEPFVRTHGGVNGRFIVVPIDEQLGGAEDVDTADRTLYP